MPNQFYMVRRGKTVFAEYRYIPGSNRKLRELWVNGVYDATYILCLDGKWYNINKVWNIPRGYSVKIVSLPKSKSRIQEKSI